MTYLKIRIIYFLVIVGILGWASPDAKADQSIVIDLQSRSLIFTDDDESQVSYPIVVGKRNTPTPRGEYEITEIEFNPTWNIPKSIQAERARKGQPMITAVPPGRKNPLGKVFMRLSWGSIGIHGNNMNKFAPGYRSHGCIRMDNLTVIILAKTVRVGTPVVIQ